MNIYQTSEAHGIKYQRFMFTIDRGRKRTYFAGGIVTDCILCRTDFLLFTEAQQ